MAAVFTGKRHIGKKAVATRASLRTCRKHGQQTLKKQTPPQDMITTCLCSSGLTLSVQGEKIVSSPIERVVADTPQPSTD